MPRSTPRSPGTEWGNKSGSPRSPPAVPRSFASADRARVRVHERAAGAEASGPRGPSPGSPRPPPGLSNSRRRHHRCSSRLCRCRRRSLDRLLFPWLRPAWQLVGCQARGGGRGRGETGREEGGRERKGGEGWEKAVDLQFSEGPSLPGYRLPKRRAAAVEGGWLRTRCGEVERRPRYSFHGAGMKLSGKELGVSACHSQQCGGAPPRGKYW